MLRGEGSGREKRTAKTSRHHIPEPAHQETDSKQTRRPSRVPAEHCQAEDMPELCGAAAGESCHSWCAMLLRSEVHTP